MRRAGGKRGGPVRRKSVDLNADAGRDYRVDDDIDEYDDGTQELDLQPIEVKRTPEDQIQGLNEEQLNEVFTKVITATNPNVSKAITRFNYQEGTFKLAPSVTHLAIHFEMDGVLIHVDSDEARDQMNYIANVKDLELSVDKKNAGTGTEDGDPTQDEDEEDLDASTLPDRALKNQFNFSERASQTFNNPLRDREVATEPPPTTEFSANVTHWEIFDAYADDLDKQMQAKATKEKQPVKKGTEDENKIDMLDGSKRNIDMLSTNENLALSLKTMERMVNQNAESECFQDYKYHEDKRNSFLPLWKFSYEKAKKKTVTAMCWNPEFTDLFAVAYGSYDFMKQNSGIICCYSLKNTQYPEYKFTTDSGVMCLDFHPQHTALLVAGLYDGTVCVYDVRTKSNEPIYISSDPKVKHTDPVWQVHWQKEDIGKNINFFSISSDGRVTNWIMNKNELCNEEVIELKLLQGTKDHEEIPDNAMVGLAGGCSFDFNKTQEHLFVVGTEEGAIHTYSKAYNSQFLRAFEGHHMAVYAVKWNPFHPGVFLSCSADWTVKLWEVNTSKPVMTFDLNCSVGDIAWAPYSATVFGVVTSDGKVRIYDLNINKHEPVGETRVNKKAKLTHITFNPKEPIICVGDDRGVVNILKLSPLMTKTTAPTLEELDSEEEIEKLDRLLIIPDRETAAFVKTDKKDKKKDDKKKLMSPKSPGSKPGTSNARGASREH